METKVCDLGIVNDEELGELPDLEIGEIKLFEGMPENLTYPEIQPILIDRIVKEINMKVLK